MESGNALTAVGTSGSEGSEGDLDTCLLSISAINDLLYITGRTALLARYLYSIVGTMRCIYHQHLSVAGRLSRLKRLNREAWACVV